MLVLAFIFYVNQCEALEWTSKTHGFRKIKFYPRDKKGLVFLFACFFKRYLMHLETLMSSDLRS